MARGLLDQDATMLHPTVPSSRTLRPFGRAIGGSRGLHRRGFTLVELMIVVAMIGVLAALALVGYRRYITSAQTTEATAVLMSVRAGQENWKANEGFYLAVSGADLTAPTFVPRALGVLDDRKVGWPDPAPASWEAIGARPDGPVRFTYAVVADVAGTPPPTTFLEAPDPLWANSYGGGDSPEPWFVAVAVADRNENGTRCVVEAGSFTNEVFIFNELE